jgi:predicted acylesterase/phospholipase RssA
MAIADMVPRGTRNPFPIICGTSAGALNAAALSANAHNYRMAVKGLERVWSNITAEQVYRTDLICLCPFAVALGDQRCGVRQHPGKQRLAGQYTAAQVD